MLRNNQTSKVLAAVDDSFLASDISMPQILLSIDKAFAEKLRADGRAPWSVHPYRAA
jgi:hypothetical protein